MSDPIAYMEEDDEPVIYWRGDKTYEHIKSFPDMHKHVKPLYTTVDQLGGAPEDLRNVLCGVIELFGLEGTEKITAYALKHRGTNAFDGRKVEKHMPMNFKDLDHFVYGELVDEVDGTTAMEVTKRVVEYVRTSLTGTPAPASSDSATITK